MSQLTYQRVESTVLQAGEDRKGQGRAAKVLRHNNTQPARPPSCHGAAAATVAQHDVNLLSAAFGDGAAQKVSSAPTAARMWACP